MNLDDYLKTMITSACVAFCIYANVAAGYILFNHISCTVGVFWIVHILYTDHSSAAGEFFWRYIPFKCAGDVFSTYSVYSAGVFFVWYIP